MLRIFVLDTVSSATDFVNKIHLGQTVTKYYKSISTIQVENENDATKIIETLSKMRNQLTPTYYYHD